MSKGATQPLAEVSASDLDILLQHFFAQLTKKDGSEYEPESLRTMIAALERHIKGLGCRHSILKDREFDGCRKVLNGKAIELREKGKGKRRNKADAVSESEEKLLWDSGVLGKDNPVSLNHAVFYTLSQHFGTRGRQEHHQFRVEDLKFVKNPISGRTEHVEWVEGPTKTRQGGLVKQDRRVPQKAYKTGETSCPVTLLEKLLSKRPESLKTSGPLYLTPLRNYADKEVWYSITPVGVNTINNYMKRIATEGKLNGTGKRLTNHSIRKTVVKKLQKQGISNDKIMAITGHKSEQSLRSYAEMDENDHADISRALSGSHSSGTDLPSQILQELFPSTSGRVTYNNYNFYFGNTQANNSLLPPTPKRGRVFSDDV